MRGLSLVVASGGHSSSWCAGLSLLRPLLLQSTGSRRAGSVIVAQGPSCSAACGIFPDQGSNPCPLHWQADSQQLRHQGSPEKYICMSSLTDPKESLRRKFMYIKQPSCGCSSSKENPTARPNRSHFPVKSIASFSVKMLKYKVAHLKQALGASESSSKVPDEVR